MAKTIEFIARDDHVWKVRPKPYPAIKNLPQWWKDTPAYSNEEKKLNLIPYPSVTVKRCVPVLDALGSGYYVPLWSDILIQQEGGLPVIRWNSKVQLIDPWGPQQVGLFEFPEGYSKTAFKHIHGWTIKTPPGWSCLFIHPVAYPNLPFRTISGIVDTDIHDGDINVPFVVKEGFEGVVERDTPMFQVIPFKREQWNSEFSVKKPNQHFYDMEKLYSKINRAYYSLITDKKTYK